MQSTRVDARHGEGCIRCVAWDHPRATSPLSRRNGGGAGEEVLASRATSRSSRRPAQPSLSSTRAPITSSCGGSAPTQTSRTTQRARSQPIAFNRSGCLSPGANGTATTCAARVCRTPPDSPNSMETRSATWPGCRRRQNASAKRWSRRAPVSTATGSSSFRPSSCASSPCWPGYPSTMPSRPHRPTRQHPWLWNSTTRSACIPP